MTINSVFLSFDWKKYMYVVARDTCAYSRGEGKGNWKVSGSYMTYENIDF